MATPPQRVSLGSATDSNDEVSLLEILDHVLNSGVVIQGSIVISVAGVDLLYVGLNVVLTSVETALKTLRNEEAAARKQLR
ncbi:MAG: gas vesicle protein GVPa [Acidobacteriales bacterium]|nr:gas vesicle protein GVPa [Terriglobales bacterium]